MSHRMIILSGEIQNAPGLVKWHARSQYSKYCTVFPRGKSRQHISVKMWLHYKPGDCGEKNPPSPVRHYMYRISHIGGRLGRWGLWR